MTCVATQHCELWKRTSKTVPLTIVYAIMDMLVSANFDIETITSVDKSGCSCSRHDRSTHTSIKETCGF